MADTKRRARGEDSIFFAPSPGTLALLEAAKTHRLWAYVAVSLLGGLRTEEARALRWPEVDLDAGTVAVYRSVRFGGDTKTENPAELSSCPISPSRRCAGWS